MNIESKKELYSISSKSNVDNILSLIEYLDNYSEDDVKLHKDDKNVLEAIEIIGSLYQLNAGLLINDTYDKKRYNSIVYLFFRSNEFKKQLCYHLDNKTRYIQLLELTADVFENIYDKKMGDLALILETLILLSYSIANESVYSDLNLDNKHNYKESDVAKIDNIETDIGFNKLSLVNKKRKYEKPSE